jgi:hypothetical protein
MIKKSLAIFALAGFVAVGACTKADDTENLGVDTTVAPVTAPEPIATDTFAAPVVDSTAVVTDSAAVDTTVQP